MAMCFFLGEGGPDWGQVQTLLFFCEGGEGEHGQGEHGHTPEEGVVITMPHARGDDHLLLSGGDGVVRSWPLHFPFHLG